MRQKCACQSGCAELQDGRIRNEAMKENLQLASIGGKKNKNQRILFEVVWA